MAVVYGRNIPEAGRRLDRKTHSTGGEVNMPLPRRNVTLEDDKYAILVEYGGGCFADGCRRAAELVRHTESVRGSRECKCSLREKAVGDGCDVCNPERAKDLSGD